MSWLGRGVIAAVSALLVLAALDRLVAFLDLGYTPARGRPNQHRRVERAEFSADVRLNALGFREPRLPSPKTPGTVRIVALRDSVTEGFGVEASLNAQEEVPHEVVNLGGPGPNPRDYLSHLRDPGLAYEPDVVLVTVMANDVQDRWTQLAFGVQSTPRVLV